MTHLILVNDCFIVAQGMLSESIILKQIVVCYFGKDVDVQIQRRISRVFAIRTGSLPFKYLEAFVGSKRVLL